jgi:hypothetical protein
MTCLQSRLGRSVLSALVAILVMSAPALAQDYRGKVQGVVTDSSGAALPGANVTLKNVGTGVDVTRQTNSEGRYIFDFVESGVYAVLVEATGFKKYEQRNVTVQNRGDVTVDARAGKAFGPPRRPAALRTDWAHHRSAAARAGLRSRHRPRGSRKDRHRPRSHRHRPQSPRRRAASGAGIVERTRLQDDARRKRLRARRLT